MGIFLRPWRASLYLSPMRRKMGMALGKFILWLGGWKIVSGPPPGLKQAVLISAPHTSNWDFLWARTAFYVIGLPLRFTIKKEFMKFPFGPFMRSMGAIAIDRSKPGQGQKGGKSSVDAMVDLFEEYETLFMIVTPEGTRSYNPNWKTGFYHVALKAGVPMLPGYLDYAKREAGIGPAFVPTGNVDEDIEKIKDFFRPIKGKFPENGVR